MKKKRILLVESYPSSREGLLAFLTLNFEVEVTTAFSLEEGLLLLETYPHLLITDYHLPSCKGGDGLVLVSSARQKNIPSIVFAEGIYFPLLQSYGYAAGAGIVFPKPPNLKELGEIVKRLLNRSLQKKIEIL